MINNEDVHEMFTTLLIQCSLLEEDERQEHIGRSIVLIYLHICDRLQIERPSPFEINNRIQSMMDKYEEWNSNTDNIINNLIHDIKNN